MKHFLATLTFLFVGSLTLLAVPAYRGPIQMTQADGTTKTVYRHGDEHFNYITDANGQWLKWQDGMLIRTEALSEDEIVAKRESSPMRIAQQRRVAQSDVNLAPHGLVILVNFTNKQFGTNNTREEFENMMNQPNYLYRGARGSVKDYFRTQSFGLYDPTFDVIGPVTLDTTYQYYGKNSGGVSGQDMRPDRMIVDACRKADKEFNIDFSQYDNDGDGKVDFVFVFYAGRGEADSGDSDVIWPHMSYVYNSGYGTSCYLDGVLIDQYACSNELPGTGSYHVGISTCCHEFSHVMGLPDMYNTSNPNDYETLGNWDIMDAGPYNNNGRTPPAYSGYERFFCGFAQPVILNSPCDVTLTEIQRSGQVLLITATGYHNMVGNKPTPTTFYILENRQKVKNDKYLPGHGLLITKIQYNQTAWFNNTVNSNASNHRIAIQTADGEISLNSYTGMVGDGGDTYPGTAKVTSFSPIAEYPVTEITEQDSLIHFKFMGGGQELPLALSETEQSEHQLLIANSQLTIDRLTPNSQITVYNLTGQIVTNQTATEQQINITLNPGIYIVRVNNKINKIIIH